MWKKRILALALLLCAVILTACQQKKEEFPTQPRQQEIITANPAPTMPSQQNETGTVNYDNGVYNPALEENGQDELIGNGMTPAPTMYSEYAGATPVRIDPVDKPTPTPLPQLTFTYATYTADALHLTFEGPAGWMADASVPDTYTLTYPNPSMDYEAKIVIRVAATNKNYNKNELTKEVKSALDTLRSDGNFESFETSNTATRTFIDGNGVYATYKGTLKDENKTGVAGRLIINCVNKNLYILNVSYPRALADTFAEGVYNKVRHTMKLTTN